LNESTAYDAEVVSGAKSQFDVVADGELIFSKQKEGRFPDHDEIIRALS
jgi:predicted Rdx family selenoprotein